MDRSRPSTPAPRLGGVLMPCFCTMYRCAVPRRTKPPSNGRTADVDCVEARERGAGNVRAAALQRPCRRNEPTTRGTTARISVPTRVAKYDELVPREQIAREAEGQSQHEQAPSRRSRSARAALRYAFSSRTLKRWRNDGEDHQVSRPVRGWSESASRTPPPPSGTELTRRRPSALGR